ncbi:MAG: hypothetical protein K2X90_03030 [Candidatus Babeliaceae bacterium]|nr:hypothetical protein [Candidatus Babeliaceae bacterium]
MKKILLLLTLILATKTNLLSKINSNNIIDFNFADKELTEIINVLAEKSEMNIIFPQGANAIKQKVNIHLPNKISLEKAWDYTAMLLNLAGYTMIPHNGVHMIIKNDPNSNRDTLPIYVGYNPQDFPQTENKIRSILYLTNLKVPEKYNASDDKDPINQILTDVLSTNKSITFDTKTNAIIAADSANKLSTAFNIIMLLDRSGDPNVLEAVRLYNVDASIVADLLKTQILALTGTEKGTLKSDVKSETGLYFGPNQVHLVADNRLNAIILSGSSPTIELIKDLIAELDQPVDSGRSILHVYELQYLDATTFAPILQKIVKSGTETAQATKDLQGGIRKAFEGVIVVAEEKVEEKAEALQTTGDQKSLLQGSVVFKGGNRIIITARQDDWLKIKDLIRSLDIPQPIVIIEVMVIDVNINESKILGTQIRNLTATVPTTIQSNGVTAQAALANPGGVVLNSTQSSGTITTMPEPAKLASDLLSLISPGSSGGTPASLARTLSSANPGSLIMSFNDPNGTGIWGVLQVLDSFSDLKVLSHPFLVTRNNREAETIISTIRRDQGQAFAGQAAVVSQKVEDIEARLRVGIISRVASLDRVNMQIAVDVQEFTTSVQTNYTRNTRTVNTSSNLSSGQILALGGLSTLLETESTYKVPILADIPLIGPFFQYNERTTNRTNLLILISPTIIEPKVRGGVEIYTRDKISKGFEVFETQSVIGNPRDPVTRWFFKSNLEDALETTNVYLSTAQGDFVRELEKGLEHKRDNTKPRRSRRLSKKNKTMSAGTRNQEKNISQKLNSEFR